MYLSNDLDNYQQEIAKFATYPETGTGSVNELTYLALGLCGEAGEYSEKVKKLIRDGVFDPELAIKELGDVLWYLARSAAALGYDLSTVAAVNRNKLQDRLDRNKLQGSGDTR